MFSTNSLKQLVFDVNSIARGAGEKINQFFNARYEVNFKKDKSPVTTADLAANEYITGHLRTLTPQLPLLSEESTAVDFQERKNWDEFWLIDPLDGTREFIKNNPDFTVNIALIQANRPVLGVIYLPVENLLYFATFKNGAYKSNGNEEYSPISVKNPGNQTPRICGSRANPGKSMQKFLLNIGEHELISRGSSIKSCMVAEGSVDIYPRFGPTWEWDTAAAQCIVEQAGGSLTDFNMEKLEYNKESMLNPSFLAYGDKNIDWQKYLL